MAGDGDAPTVTDTHGNAYSLLAAANASLGCALLFGRVTDATLPDTVTAGLSQSVENRITVADYTGVPPSGDPLFDGSAAVAIASATTITGAITTAQANDVLVGIVASGLAPTAGVGFTSQDMTTFSLLEDEVLESPGDHTAAATFISANEACLGVIAVEGEP